jgi:hypothetical protein
MGKRLGLSRKLAGVCLLALLVALAAGVMCTAKPVPRTAPAEAIAANYEKSGLYLGYDQTTKQWGWTAYVQLQGCGFENEKYSMFPTWWDANQSKGVIDTAYLFNPYGQGYTGNVQSAAWAFTIPLDSPHGQAILLYGVGVDFEGSLYWDSAPGAPKRVKVCTGTVYPDP